MITLKQAFKIAKDSNISGIPLSRIAEETDEFWVFDFDTNELLNGILPIAVEKKDGRCWGVFPPLMSKEQWNALEHAKKVTVPLD